MIDIREKRKRNFELLRKLTTLIRLVYADCYYLGARGVELLVVSSQTG